MRTLVWDIETMRMPEDGEASDAYIVGCGISLAAVWDVVDNEWTLYGAQDLEKLAEALEGADRVVGYNSLGFDHLVLDAAIGRRVIIQDEVDLWRIIQASMGSASWGPGQGTLDAVSRRTLGRGKSGSGSDAPDLAQQGKWYELANYCMHDVELTLELHKFMETHGYVINPVGQKHMVGQKFEQEGPNVDVEPVLGEKP